MRALRQSAFRLYGAGGAAELLGVNAGTLASTAQATGDQRGRLEAIATKPDAALTPCHAPFTAGAMF